MNITETLNDYLISPITDIVTRWLYKDIREYEEEVARNELAKGICTGDFSGFKKSVFTDMKTGRQLSYSEMRMKYG